MPARRTWIVPCRLGPFTTARWATIIGLSMSPSVVIGRHVLLPLDAGGWSDRMIIVGGPMTLEDSSHLFDHPGVLVYSRRRHDVTDESDAADTVLLGSWLASSGVELVDWLIMTRRTVRSIPADFGLPRLW